MSDVTKVVKERYVAGGAAGPERIARPAVAARRARPSSCCGASPLVPGAVDPITANLYDAQQTGGLPAEAVAGLARLRQSHGARHAAPGRGRARSRIGRRHRRAAVGAAGRAPRARPTAST
ncbi:MAG: hypothetical protein MZW92_29290 [Comamonadaceae bacterium]|nr:hypothetical protein [Comamonadaceae bacterium]